MRRDISFGNGPVVFTQPVDTAHRIRGFLKFALAIAAVGSAAFGFFQTFAPSRSTEVANAPRRDERTGRERSYFQALIEADRKQLEARRDAESKSAVNLWVDIRPPVSGAQIPGEGEARDQTGLRASFTQGDPLRSQTNKSGWNVAFVPVAAPAGKVAAAPVPARPPSELRTSPAAQAPGVQMQPAPEPAKPSVAGSPQSQPRSGFAEARRVAPAVQTNGPAAATGGFVQVNGTGQRPGARAERDDLEFLEQVTKAAERDFAYLQRAQLVLDEFNRRFPHMAEVVPIQRRVAHASAVHAATMHERTTLKADTPLAAVLMHEEPLASLRACLSGIPELAKLSAVTRPVLNMPGRLAFFVSARLTGDGASDASSKDLEAAARRARVTTTLSVCLEPMLKQGSVALMLGAKEEDPLAQARIEDTPEALLYRRTQSVRQDFTASTP